MTRYMPGMGPVRELGHHPRRADGVAETDVCGLEDQCDQPGPMNAALASRSAGASQPVITANRSAEMAVIGQSAFASGVFFPMLYAESGHLTTLTGER
jgi:hypothetical protein